MIRIFPILFLLFVSCTTAPKIGGVKIGEYVSSNKGFLTSSYWIEGPTGLILIDTQFLPSAALEFVERAENTTEKKAKLAFVLHANPDKFNGTKVLRDRGIRVVTSKQVRDLIPAVHELRKGWFYDRFKPDYPENLTLPESFGDETTELEAGGIKVRAHVMGAGCGKAHVVVEFDGHFFVGDLMTKGFHSWLELGLIPEWLKNLNEIEAMKPSVLHTGRGGSGGMELIDSERKYLIDAARVVRNEKLKTKVLDEAAMDRMENTIGKLYPSYRYTLFVRNGLDALWERKGL